jgi:glycosyltransferase involved in cell wall biosynthesis
MGGAEQQTLLLARGLADLGHKVVFLATEAPEEDKFQAGMIAVRKIPGWQVVGRSAHREYIAKAVQKSRPDVAYVRMFPALQAIVPQCRAAQVPVVSVSCHLLETTPFLLAHGLKAALWYLRTSQQINHIRSFLSIRACAAHVCNTKSLQHKIQPWFPRKRIRTIYNGQPVPPQQAVHQQSSGQVIWVNNLKRWKQPEVLIDLARRLPQFRFVMIGRMAEGSYGKDLQRALGQASSNLQYLGPKPIGEVNTLISQSDLLLYTSRPLEGFGNSFLQAWFRGVPTVSLSFDLDGILEREGVGRCSRAFEQLVLDVKELMEDETTRAEMGRRAREYAVGYHSAEKMVADYEALFREVAGNGSGVDTK